MGGPDPGHRPTSLLEAADAVVDAANDLGDALTVGLEALAEVRRLLEAGTSVTATLAAAGAEGRERRLRAGNAIDVYERAVMEFRGALVRGLVAEGMTLTDAARAMGVSRQFASRLYAGPADDHAAE